MAHVGRWQIALFKVDWNDLRDMHGKDRSTYLDVTRTVDVNDVSDFLVNRKELENHFAIGGMGNLRISMQKLAQHRVVGPKYVELWTKFG